MGSSVSGVVRLGEPFFLTSVLIAALSWQPLSGGVMIGPEMGRMTSRFGESCVSKYGGFSVRPRKRLRLRESGSNLIPLWLVSSAEKSFSFFGPKTVWHCKAQHSPTPTDDRLRPWTPDSDAAKPKPDENGEPDPDDNPTASRLRDRSSGACFASGADGSETLIGLDSARCRRIES
jgi:hypothetical protein